MDTSKITELNTKNGQAKPIETTKKELTEEAKQFITDTCKTIILDAIPKDDLESYLYLVNVTTDEETKDYNAAILYLFTIPKSMDQFVCVNTIRIDLLTREISTPPVFFAPIVLRKDSNGIERDAVIVGRYGDISITSANSTITIASQNEIDEYYAKKEVEDATMLEEMLAMNDLDK